MVGRTGREWVIEVIMKHLRRHVVCKAWRWSLIFACMAIGFWVHGLDAQGHTLAPGATIPSPAPVLINGDFECDFGYTEGQNARGKTIRIPDGWTYHALDGSPIANSARIQFAKACDSDSAHVERISGRDSFVIRAQDLETPPTPGKAFDVALSQQVAVVTGGDYSVSGWFLSLCGGSAVPSDCPDGVFMVKMLGLDPTGGEDPAAASVIWVENLENFVDANENRIGWSNLRLSAVAKSRRMTVFARVRSPFQWHGNHAFMDALSLVRAPIVNFTDLASSVTGPAVTLAWEGVQSPDIAAIPGGTYELRYDLQARHHADEAWYDLALDTQETTFAFHAPCLQSTYDFRIRVRAEQPPAPPEGASPNQRYPGSWSPPHTVEFLSAAPARSDPVAERIDFVLFLPVVVQARDCSVH